tara:strand:+ start:171060 stop:172187 length:1128 start_codon:yes stop_codon:yes gene_type:complete
MSTSPLSLYTQALQSGEIEDDAAQALVIEALDALHSRLSNQKTPFLHFFRKKDKIEGLYIYGGVGRGKTFLMDMFFDSLPDTVKKKRIHFHEFMRDAHDFLHQKRQDKTHKDADALIPALADWISGQCSVLCFDEFHVVDIADAMILGRLLDALFARGIILICTSNWPPKDLYKDGLQRARFLPAIDLIQRHMITIHLDSQNDYRLGRLSDSDLYHYPNDREAENRINSLFAKLTDCTAGKAETLIHKNRSITVPCAAAGVARFRFQDLCEQPLGAGDYMMLAEKYHTIIVENIPPLGYDRRNETKRLITLIDVLYEQGTMVIITAAREPAKLYSGADHKFEFDRTVSRLLEMQSQDYRSAHQARIEKKIDTATA